MHYKIHITKTTANSEELEHTQSYSIYLSDLSRHQY